MSKSLAERCSIYHIRQRPISKLLDASSPETDALHIVLKVVSFDRNKTNC